MSESRKQPKTPRSPVKEAILRRIKVLYVFFFLLGIAILARIIWLQVGSESKLLRSRAQQYSFRMDSIAAARGNIYSDDGRLLATSIPYYELRMDLAADGLSDTLFKKNVDSLAFYLADFFKDKTKDQYKEDLETARLQKKGYYLVNRRKIDYLELQQIRKFPLFRLDPNKGGFMAIESNRRVHPNGELAGRTLGFVNQSGYKVGIEGGFDNYLRGTTGRTMKQKISGTFWTPIASAENYDPVDGLDVVSTLNIEMQDMVQQALRQWVTEAEADWGCAIVMEVSTGNVKAISNVTRNSDGTMAEDYNYAIGMSMEPGSTFKMPVMLALLDDAKMPLSTIIHTGNGVEQIGPVRVVDSRSGGYGTLTLQGVFEKSSNVGMAKAVNQSYGGNAAKFVDALLRLGIDKPLDLQLAGEAKPLVKHPNLKNGWDGMTMTMMSYGYALRVAPIHTLTLYNAIANNGVMVKPIFVRELKQHETVVQTFQTDTLNAAICSPQTLTGIRGALEGVVTNGTGSMLKNPKYRVAAKTGTAQIAIGRSGYTTRSGGRHYLGSMVGYMPAERPKYSIIVALKTYRPAGSSKPYYGGSLAGPIFRTIADRIYALDFNFDQTITPRTQIYEPGLGALPGSSDELALLMRDLQVAGVPGTSRGDSTVMLSRGQVVTPAPMPLTAGVPDLRGLTLIEALPLAEGVGLRARFVGVGTVKAQSLEPGDPFEQGQEVVVTLGLK